MLRTNVFPIRMRQDYVLYHYHVDFNPPVPSTAVRKSMIAEKREMFGNFYMFDGMQLFLQLRLENDVSLLLPVTFLHAPFLSLLHRSGTLYLHTFVLSTVSLHSSGTLNHTSSSQLSLPSHSAPAPVIRFSRFWRSINLVVCMYVCYCSLEVLI